MEWRKFELKDDQRLYTCSSCDYHCPDKGPADTCDKWERTVMECDVPDEFINAFQKMNEDIQMEKMREELQDMGYSWT